MECGIVGLPNVGKSTLFNALLKKQVAQSANYPFTTIEPNVGVVEVPDERLGKLKEVVQKSEGLRPEFKIIPAVVKFVDIAGLVKGAAQGEGLGNQFLSHIREVDVIVFVLRDFSGEIIRAGSENPKEDLEVLKSELLLKDLETINKVLETRDMKQDAKSREILERAKSLVEQGKWLSDELDNLEKIADLQLLSAKKTIVVLNTDEDKLRSQGEFLKISAKLEEELAGLSEEEQKEYLKEVGQEKPGLNILITKAYETLDLISFFTAGPKEVRAWTLRRGSTALRASGTIHTDFERGFIAADVIPWDQLLDGGGWQAAKAKGLVKTIGKTEEIKDGYVVEFRFSV